MSTRTKSYWSKGQIELFVKDVRKRVGDGWRLLVPQVQAALIGQKALYVIQGQHADSIDKAAIDELHADMLEYAGLTDVERP